jgi:hypothetical protein
VGGCHTRPKLHHHQRYAHKSDAIPSRALKGVGTQDFLPADNCAESPSPIGARLGNCPLDLTALPIFGEEVTPNQHALARQYVVLDNLYCDGEVSVDGHSWSNSAYATDFNERYWPPTYAGRSDALPSRAYIPSAGHLWDLAARKGLTYRSYGEYASRASNGTTMDAAPGVGGLVGHVAADYLGSRQRDTANVAVFLKEFKEYEKNYDSPDPNKRFPNFVVMSMPEDHTRGTAPGAFTPQAMVANNDYTIGQLVDAVTQRSP